jgi:hypothetical protein
MAVFAALPRVGPCVVPGDRPDRPRTDLNRPWRAVSKRAALDGVRIHDLRHTHASIGAGAGLGLPIIGKLLGHAQAATTARYAHLDADPLRCASEIIGGRIAAAMGEAFKLESALPSDADIPDDSTNKTRLRSLHCQSSLICGVLNITAQRSQH